MKTTIEQPKKQPAPAKSKRVQAKEKEEEYMTVDEFVAEIKRQAKIYFEAKRKENA